MSRPTRGAMSRSRPEAPGVAPAVRGWAAPGDKTRARAKPTITTTTTKAKAGAKPEAANQAGKQRLQKVLASAGVAARRKAEDLISAGRVKVNGKVVKELGSKVDPDRDQIYVDGKQVLAAKKVYFVLNKPDGVVCSAEGNKDGEGRPTVLSLFPALPQRIYPVGRLDFHTRGVLILTNDGELAAALTHPRHEVTKTYHVKFQGRMEAEDLARLGQPITLEDGTVTRAAEEISVIKDTDTNTWVQVTLRQGLNRQIRRMGDAIGRPVLKLIRVAVAGLTADGLADGEFRPMTPTEVYDLMSAANPEPKSRKPARARAAKTEGAAKAEGAAKPAGTAKPADSAKTTESAKASPAKPASPATAVSPASRSTAGSARPAGPRTPSDQTRKPSGIKARRAAKADPARRAGMASDRPNTGDPRRAASASDRPNTGDPRRAASASDRPNTGDRPRSSDRPNTGDPARRAANAGDRPRSGDRPKSAKPGEKARRGKPGEARKRPSAGRPSAAGKAGKAGRPSAAGKAGKAGRPSAAGKPSGAGKAGKAGGQARPGASKFGGKAGGTGGKAKAGGSGGKAKSGGGGARPGGAKPGSKPGSKSARPLAQRRRPG